MCVWTFEVSKGFKKDYVFLLFFLEQVFINKRNGINVNF